MDFVYRQRRENTQLIADALKPFNPIPVEWPEGVPFIWDAQTLLVSSILTLDTDLGRIDFIARPDGAPEFEKLIENSVGFDLEGHEIRVASIDDLIKMKEAAGRPKDLAHISELRSLRKIADED